MGGGCASRSKIWLSGWEIDFSLIWERTSSQYALKIEQAVLGNCDFPNTWGIQVRCGGLALERTSIMWEVLSNQLWNAFEIEFLRLYNISSSAWRWQNFSRSELITFQIISPKDSVWQKPYPYQPREASLGDQGCFSLDVNAPRSWWLCIISAAIFVHFLSVPTPFPNFFFFLMENGLKEVHCI